MIAPRSCVFHRETQPEDPMSRRISAIATALAVALLASLFTLVLVGVPRTAEASSCFIPTSTEGLEAVYVAEVVTKTYVETIVDLGIDADVYEYEINVVEVLFGSVPDNLKLVIAEQNGINLGLQLSEGAVYGILAYGFDGNIGSAGVCTAQSEAYARELTGAGPAACTITGTPDDDTLSGTPGRDVICGLGGNDTIDGLGGPDILRGDDGDDILTGDAGSDVLEGGAGNDVLLGNAGSDVLLGASGRDRLVGGSGSDDLRGGSGRDRLFGGSGNDGLRGGGANDRLFGGKGFDFLAGGKGDDILRGGADNDFLDGQAGNNLCADENGDELAAC